jgi:hypothetical protein
MTPRYSVGIDLGTTHSVVAYTPLDGERAELRLLMIPQAVAPGQIDSFPSLPSFLYLPTKAEAEAYALPWDRGEDGSRYVVGEAARVKGAESPQRVVSTAKSWLAHAGVDRHAAILPWQAPEEVGKVSPLEASRAYLAHLVAAWDHAHPEDPLRRQQVVLTVPASFDPAARDLTRQAAIAAGLPDDLVLLEEPQAAVYRWVEGRGDRWRRELSPGDSILVIDVGGGTTDLTLVRLAEIAGTVELQRQAIGNHLLIGGDNMDLALAYLVSQKLEAKGHRLDPWQNVALWHSCRNAKERLLRPEGSSGLGTQGSSVSDTPGHTETISVLGRGSRLIGGTISVEVDRDEAAELLLSGFFPSCSIADRPARSVSSGFQDVGLPYESDPAITKHVAAFLSGQADADGRGSVEVPTHLLFNGGVFRAIRFRDRVREVVAGWAAGKTPDVLGGPEDLDQAVALGAAYYGWSKRRGGVRIRGGTARSYYIGIETAGLAIPGAPRPLRAMCIAPRGMEEGTEADVPAQQVGVIVGRPSHFRFFSSTVRPDDVVGTSLDRWGADELVESDPIHTTLDSESVDPDTVLPVKFQSRVTELGMFELYCLSTRTDERWKMSFNAREEVES